MKPTNKKEYNRSILVFFAMWAFTTALIVFACLQPFKTPKLENIRLKKQVEALEKDSTQQYLLSSTIVGINATMTSLNQRYDEDTLQKLSNYPNVKLENTEMKKKLTIMSERIAKMYEEKNQNKGGLQEQLKQCKNRLEAVELQSGIKDERIQQLNERLRQQPGSYSSGN